MTGKHKSSGSCPHDPSLHPCQQRKRRPAEQRCLLLAEGSQTPAQGARMTVPCRGALLLVRCRPAARHPSPVLVQTRTSLTGLRGALLLCMRTHSGEGHPACLLGGHAPSPPLGRSLSAGIVRVVVPLCSPLGFALSFPCCPPPWSSSPWAPAFRLGGWQAESGPEQACTSTLTCAEPQHPHRSLGPLVRPWGPQPLSLRLRSSCGSLARRPPPSACGPFSPHGGGAVTPVWRWAGLLPGGGGFLTLSTFSSAGVLTSSASLVSVLRAARLRLAHLSARLVCGVSA